MIRIKEKLNSNAGASMIFALAFMLVCIVVSSIIISAAASGVGRNSKRTTQQREYLAVTSAAELIAKELKDAGSFIGQKESQTPGCLEYSSGTPETFQVTTVVGDGSVTYTYTGYRLAEPLDLTAEMSFLIQEKKDTSNVIYTYEPCTEGATIAAQDSELGGNLKLLLKEAATYVMEHNKAYGADEPDEMGALNENRGVFYISVDGEDRLPKVKCQLTMDENYNVTVEVSVNSADSLVVTMELDEISEQMLGGSGATTTCANKHMVLTIYPDGSVVENEEYQFVNARDALSTKISWKEPVITKGGQNE